MRSIRSGIVRRTSASKQRTVPFIFASSGMTLNVVPLVNWATVTTAGSLGATSRLTIVCSAVTTYAPAAIGSTANCGIAPCPPWPRTVRSNSSAEAKNAPSRTPILPTSRPL